MVTMAQLRAGVADSLSGLRGVQVLPYMTANPKPPSLWVFPGPTTYDAAMRRGLDMVTLTIQAFASMPVPRRAQEILDGLLEPTGSQSVKALIEAADSTWVGLGVNVHVTEATGYQTAVVEGKGSVLLCEWTVAVMASN